MKIRFIGACGEVTGSMHLVEAHGKRILLDCGMRQGKGKLKTPHLPFEPEEIDFIILSHAHVDHSGILPWFVDRGFDGKIIATEATKELCNLLLQDSAKIMKEEYERGGEFPLYSEESVLDTISKFKTMNYEKTLRIADGITMKFYDAGHILGSAITLLNVKGSGIICYTGDLGHGMSPILNPPAVPKEDIDYLIIESTYGDRRHEDFNQGKLKLAEVINETVKKGKLLIPVFAVGRAQEVIYCIKELMENEKIPRVKVYIDTPMGFSATELYSSFGYCLRKDFYSLFLRGKNPFEFPELDIIKGSGRSIEVARSDERCIVLAASGMLEGGRIVNHLPYVLSNENSSILFVGYQAEGTLGRQIFDGEKLVEINGQSLEVKCRIEVIKSFSAHADSEGLLNWVKKLRFTPYRSFVVHGEYEASKCLVEDLRKLRIRAENPVQNESFETAESKVLVERIEEFKLGFEPSFERFFGEEIFPVSGLLVKRKEGLVLLNKVQSQEFISQLLENEASEMRRSMREVEVEVRGEVEGIEEIREELKKYRDAKLLTNKLIAEVYCELLKGRDEAIRLLNLKKEKGRYNVEVRDEKLKEEFHEFMVRAISSFDEEVICRELKELNPNINCM